MNKEQVCVIISSYPQNYLDHSLLGLTIESWKHQSYDICLVSHSPLNPDIQKSSKYYIYTDENEMLEYPDLSNITWYSGNEDFLYQTNWGNTMGNHSYAILKNMQNTFYFLRSKPYTHFIYLEIDGFLTQENHNLLVEKLNEADFLNKDYWLMMEYEGLSSLPVTNFFGGRIEYFYNRFKDVDTPKKYMDMSIASGGYSLESFFGEMFVANPLGEGHIERTNPRTLFPNDWFGASISGQVYVPGLKHKDWWLDLVKNKDIDDDVYAIVSSTSHNFDTKLLIYQDDILSSTMDIKTGPLYWIKLGGEANKWRVEQTFNGEVIKKVEYTTKEIRENIWSYIDFHKN
jgi:hypothetical protein